MSIKFTNDVSLEDSLVFEKVYPENLQWDLESKQELKDEGTEFLYMVDGDTGALIGEAYFLPLDTMKDWPPDEEQAEDGLGPWYGKECIYAFSTTILPKFQGKGYGKLLKAYCLGLWKESGYHYAVGHARNGASMKLQDFFGARIVKTFSNWYQTKEDYNLYVQPILDEKIIEWCDICQENHYGGKLPQSHFKNRSKKGLSNTGKRFK